MDEAWFLHEQGYTFFDIPKLTYPEISLLIRKHNQIQRKKNLEAKRAYRRR